jgi:hypothetical protein
MSEARTFNRCQLRGNRMTSMLASSIQFTPTTFHNIIDMILIDRGCTVVNFTENAIQRLHITPSNGHKHCIVLLRYA